VASLQPKSIKKTAAIKKSSLKLQKKIFQNPKPFLRVSFIEKKEKAVFCE